MSLSLAVIDQPHKRQTKPKKNRYQVNSSQIVEAYQTDPVDKLATSESNSHITKSVRSSGVKIS
jgi:hypothetical protein